MATSDEEQARDFIVRAVSRRVDVKAALRDPRKRQGMIAGVRAFLRELEGSGRIVEEEVEVEGDTMTLRLEVER